MTKVYDNATDLITFARSSSGTALRRVGYGDELVTNGGFDTDTVWTKVNATITGGEGVLDGTGGLSMIYQDIVTNGKHYEVTFDAVVTTGSMEVINNDGTPLQDIYTTGTYTFTFTHSIANGNLLWRCPSGSNSGSIDNISVREVIFDRATDPLVLFNHPDDTPRIEYGSDGALKGLLIEEQRTNLLTYSEDFSTGTGAFNLINVDTSGASEGPDGATNSATQMLETATTGEHQVNENVSLSANTAYTLSAYVSPIGGRNCTLFWFTNSINTILSATFDLASGSVVAGPAASGSAPPTNISADIEQVGSFYRVSISGTTAGTAGAGSVRIHSTDGTSNNFLGDAGKGLNIYGAQLEAGSFATSYIPTSGSQQTRSADIASIPVTAFGYNQTAGTVVVEFDTNGSDGADYPRVFSLSNTSGTDLARFLVNPTNTTTAAVVASDLGVAFAGWSGSITPNTVETVAMALKENDFAGSLSGASVQTDQAGAMPAASDILALGTQRNLTNNYLNGHIKSLKYYPRRLTNTQLQELTS